MSTNDRKSTQRERLLEGMLHASLQSGYAGASVSRTIAQAGVSRPTFYDYFSDKDDCFLALQRECSARLVEFMAARVNEAEPQLAVQAGARALIEFAESEPGQARFLLDEAPAGGPQALDERERSLDQIAMLVERARTGADDHTLTPDIPAEALFGGLFWMLGPLLRRGERTIGAAAEPLQTWIDSYGRPSGEHRRRALDPLPELPSSPHISDIPREAPAPLPPGRPRISAAEVARNQRDRILYATALVATEKGYTAATVADIANAAKLDRRIFYNHFPDKRQAFLTLHEFSLRHAMTIAAEAFFSAPTWPERVWAGLHASCQFAAGYPALTRLAFVESHAVGSPAIQQVEDSHAAFTIFLHEGYQYSSQHPSPTALQAIVATIFEIGHRQARHGESRLMPRLLHHIAYIALAPFLKPADANKLIDEKLRSLGVEGPRAA